MICDWGQRVSRINTCIWEEVIDVKQKGCERFREKKQFCQ
jgi:hypothetical protein